MHKLINYVCDKLEELEDKVGKGEKLSMQEIEYMDMLAHTKKNLLKGEEMMDGEYSMADRSYARGRGRGAKRDAMGRYSARMSYDDAPRHIMSYDDGMRDMADTIRRMMPDMPDDVKHDAQIFVKKLEHMM